MENKKENKKEYLSTKDYSRRYNKENINIQINRELVIELRKSLCGKPLKEYIENLIRNNLY